MPVLQLFHQQIARLFLQQIAEGTGLQGWEEMLVVIVDGDDDGLHLGLLLAQRGDDFDARAVGQTKIQQRQRLTVSFVQVSCSPS